MKTQGRKRKATNVATERTNKKQAKSSYYIRLLKMFKEVNNSTHSIAI